MHWQERSQPPQPSVDVDEETIGAYVVKFNNANLYHCDIRRCLKEKVVPVFQNSEKIDFTRLIMVTFPDEPELKINFLDDDESDALQIVRGLNRFLREFQEFYKLHLSSLFNILASQYMMKTIRKAKIETHLFEDALKGMGKDLPTQLASLQEVDMPMSYDYASIDTWIPISQCVQEMFKLKI